MSNSDNKDKDGIITDKAELEKLLKQRKPLKISSVKNLIDAASCYLTGPPVPDFKPKRGGKGSILDNEVMCYLQAPPLPELPELPDMAEDSDNPDASENQDSSDDKKDDDFKGIVQCYYQTE